MPDPLPVDESAAVKSGTVVEAVREQIDGLDGIAGERPGLVAVADVLAQALDNPRAQPHHAALAGQLVKILGELSKQVKRRGELRAVLQAPGASQNRQDLEARTVDNIRALPLYPQDVEANALMGHRGGSRWRADRGNG